MSESLSNLIVLSVTIIVIGIISGWAFGLADTSSKASSAAVNEMIDQNAKKFEARLEDYINVDLMGTELMELVYQYQYESFSIIVFPKVMQGQRSVYWGRQIEGYYSTRPVSAYAKDTLKGCYKGTLRTRNDILPVDDFRSTGESITDMYIKSDSKYRMNVIKDEDGSVVGLMALQYGNWDEFALEMSYEN